MTVGRGQAEGDGQRLVLVWVGALDVLDPSDGFVVATLRVGEDAAFCKEKRRRRRTMTMMLLMMMTKAAMRLRRQARRR